MSEEKPFSPGLAGVIGAETAIGFVDGANGKLLYRGYPIEEVVAKGTYASVLDLLLTGEWHPNAVLEPVKVPPAVLAALRLLPAHAHPMDALRTAISVWVRVNDSAGRPLQMRHERLQRLRHLHSPRSRDFVKDSNQLIQSQASALPLPSCSSCTARHQSQGPHARSTRI